MKIFLLVASAMTAFTFLSSNSSATTVTGCTYLANCVVTANGFQVTDGISNLVCTNGGGCIDVSATYQGGFNQGYESAGTAGAAGFTDGFKAGYQEGLANGNQAGLTKGEQDGFNAGLNSGIYQIAFNQEYPIGFADGERDKEIDCGYGIDARKARPLATFKKTSAQILSDTLARVALSPPGRINPVGPEPVHPTPTPIRLPPLGPNLCNLITGCTVINNGYQITDGEGGIETCIHGVCQDNNPNYNSGYALGKSTALAVNYQTGYSAGTAAGSLAGYDVGYAKGYPTGYANGYDSGQATAAARGGTDGYWAGYWAGYAYIPCGFN